MSNRQKSHASPERRRLAPYYPGKRETDLQKWQRLKRRTKPTPGSAYRNRQQVN